MSSNQELDPEWRDIPGYEGHYQVSSTGKVYSLKSNIEMKPSMVSKGYHAVMLYTNGIGKMHTIHSLVALVFIGERPLDYYIHHKSEIRTDNAVHNLEYKPASEHTRGHVTGSKNVKSKLNEEKVKQIRDLHKSGVNRHVLSSMFGVGVYTIHDVVNRRNWKHVE